MGTSPLKVLIVEDDEDDYVLVRDMLRDIGDVLHEATWVQSPSRAIEELEYAHFDVCLLDFRLGAVSGIEFLSMVNAPSLSMPIIMLTGDCDRATDLRAMADGASDYLVKGRFGSDGLERAIRYAIDRKSYERELRRHVEELKAAHILLDEQRCHLIEANEKLEALAAEDPLTGLQNRRVFDERLIEEVARSQRYGHGLSLLIVDIDEFKSYNDAFGHAAGDDVIRTVASAIAAAGREGDLSARYGGEEFAMILPHTDGPGGVIIAERLCRAVADVAWAFRTVTVSIGVATLGYCGTAGLFEAADLALYEAKRLGRNQVCYRAESQAE